ncbi:MAG: MFS transporter [Lachnospiraceae bacterium]|nr:MFS transporter [Lachnospiraceae bacterium]
MPKNSIFRNKWFVLVILSAATGLIYQLPYLRYSYYDSMLNTFGYTNAQLGNLMGAYGIGSLICYVLGGIAAERFPSKYLLSGGQILTGAAGFAFAMFPPYPIALFISFFWAFTTSLIYWPTLIDYVRNLGTDKEQGRLFGLLEGLRGILTTAMGLGIVAIFNHAATETLGLRNVIFAYAIINIALGIVTFILIPYEKKAVETDGEKSSILENFMIALKKPEIWMVTIAIFCTMTCFICLGYLTPYLTGVMGATTVFAATIGTIRTWGLQIVGGTSGGVIADKIHSSSLTMAIAFCIITVGFGVMAVLPSTTSFLMTATVLMFAFGFAIYINRGIYFATFTEAGVPASINAIAVGFASAIGFLPDAFMYTVIGSILDKYSGAAGYRIVFIIGATSGLVGLLMAILIFRNSKKR